jgi:hypothetical protein
VAQRRVRVTRVGDAVGLYKTRVLRLF